MTAKYVGMAYRRPFQLLLVLAATTGLGIWGTIEIFGRVETDFRTLLPEGTDSRKALEASDERRGSSDLYTIAVESPDPHANVALIEALAERISAEWEEAQWVQIDRDPTFFREHALLYLPAHRLTAFRDDLRAALRCELQEVNAAFVELSDVCAEMGEVQWSFDSWFGKDLNRELGLSADFFGDWDKLFAEGDDREAETGDGDHETAAPGESPSANGGDGKVGLPPELDHYLISEDGTVALLYVQLDQPSTNVQFANQMQARGTDLIAELDPARFHPDMRAQVVGAYQDLNEAREAVGDSMTALVWSAGIVVLLIVGFFRAVRGLVVVVAPLVAGISWTMGLSWFTYGKLNLYTMFVGSVLLGMGIDFGIHLYGRAMESFRRGSTWVDALTESLKHTGPALVASSLTTVGALLTLLVSHFKGFKQFGVIASYGVVLCMLAAYLVIPPLIFAYERFMPLKRPQPPADEADLAPPPAAGARAFWLRVSGYVALLVVVAGVLSPGAEFEYDFRNLRGQSSTSGGIHYGRAVSRGQSTAPSIVLGRDADQMREVHELLRQRYAVERDPMLSGFLTIETYLPADQATRMEIIRSTDEDPDDPFNRRRRDDIASVVNRSALDRLEGDAKDFVDVVRDLAEVEPFTLEDIPAWAYRTLREADGSIGGLGLIFKTIQTWDVLEVTAYQARYGKLHVPSGVVAVADATFINSDIIATVQEDGKRMAGFVAAILVLILIVTLRSIRGMLICISTLATAVVLCVGAMVATNTKVGMFNMIVLPAVLGVSIDGAIHIYHRYRESGARGVGYVMRTTGLAVAAASLTTAGGFGGLLFQHHKGIASIGQLAVIGILSALVAVFLLMPGLLLLFGPKLAPPATPG